MSVPNPHAVVFRADGNAQIGLGHVMRCLALAEMLGPQYARRFAIVQPTPGVVSLLEAKGVEIIALASTSTEEFLAYLQPDEVAVLDGYTFDQAYQRAVRQHAKALVYIDDLVAGHQVADVVINHAGLLTASDYDAEAYAQFYLGTRYALLRPQFFQKPSSVPDEGPIFVSLGGADPFNTTIHVLEALLITFRMRQQQWRVHVVVGPVQANRPAIEELQKRFRHLHILSSLTAEQMAAELLRCQLAITACSTVAYEVCSVGRPLIAVQTADNQTRLATFLTEKSLANVIPAQASIHDMALAFDQGLDPDTKGLWQVRLNNQRHFFDGRSPERFSTLFARLCS